MSRRASVLILLLLLVPLPGRAMEIGPPARNLSTYRENDAGYVSLAYSTDRTDMEESDTFAYAAPGVREVKRQETYLSFAWLPHDRVEMDLRVGIQGMRVENGIAVEGRVVDGKSRMAGLVGGGVRVLAYDDPDRGIRLGVVADGSVSAFRWKKQKERFTNANDNAVTVNLHYGEYLEGRLALPVSKVIRFNPRIPLDTSNPTNLSAVGGVDWPFPEATALEVYGGPFVRFAYMYGDANASVAGQDLGSSRFHLTQDSLAGFFGGIRALLGRTHRWSVGVEGRYQSDFNVAFLVDASL